MVGLNQERQIVHRLDWAVCSLLPNDKAGIIQHIEQGLIIWINNPVTQNKKFTSVHTL